MNTAKKTNTGFGNSFLEPSSQSSRLFQQAVKVLPGGNSRTSIIYAPHPFYVQSGHGCTITDVEGVERLDFHNNYTSLIHGHADPDVVEAVSKQLQKGAAFGALTESEIELAQIITELFESLEPLPEEKKSPSLKVPITVAMTIPR